jgi:XapX domain-containing protein
MRLYLLSLAAGVLVGIIYGLLDIRSPAPPVVALVGLFGILGGEQVVPVAKRLVAGQPIHVAWVKSEALAHVFGHMTKTSATLPNEKKEHT